MRIGSDNCRLGAAFPCWPFLVPLLSRFHVSVHGFVPATVARHPAVGAGDAATELLGAGDSGECDLTGDGDRAAAMDRRRWLVCSSPTVASAMVAASGLSLPVAAANAEEQTPTDVEQALAAARSALQSLLDNWSNAVIDCTYADVPRDLLAADNKELLLEKAKTSALFDKSASVTYCKTVNTRVRDYIGVTGKGPVSVLPKVLKAGIVDMMDRDDVGEGDLDRYVQTTEQVQRALFKADSLSYEARRDFNSMNNFDESQKEKVVSDASSNLFKSREAVEGARDGLDVLLRLLQKKA